MQKICPKKFLIFFSMFICLFMFLNLFKRIKIQSFFFFFFLGEILPLGDKRNLGSMAHHTKDIFHERKRAPKSHQIWSDSFLPLFFFFEIVIFRQ